MPNKERARAEQEERFVALLEQMRMQNRIAGEQAEQLLMNGQLKSMEALMKQQSDAAAAAAANMETTNKRMHDVHTANMKLMEALAKLPSVQTTRKKEK